MLKKDISINIEKITSLIFEFKISERLLNGKKPPDEISVIDKLKESKVLKSQIFKATNIKNVRTV